MKFATLRNSLILWMIILGEASVMQSTVINTSKEMMAYSDYPPPSQLPNFMHNTQVMEYFRNYAKHFKLIPHIRFQTEILLMKRADDYNQTGRWHLTIKDLKFANSSAVYKFHNIVFLA